MTAPTTEQARDEIQRIPGGVALIPDSAYRDTPVQTLKDVLGWTPGVIIQPRFGDDARLSIRGSGLSRAYGNRGINVFMDGVPINTSDGLVDFMDIDPSAYRYVEVFKGANALRLGGNALGGAINLVTPTGRDVQAFAGRIDTGSFGYLKGQASTGGVAGPWDVFVTGSAQRQDGYRDHSRGDQQRLSANLGYQFSAVAETRFYLNANRIRQLIPGEVSRSTALQSPRTANPAWVEQDQARNIDSFRLSNKTTLRFGPTTVELGIFGIHRHVMHPIYQWLDYRVLDYGGFLRATDERHLGGFRNRFVVGTTIHNGTIDTEQFANVAGNKGAMTASMVDRSQNYSAYAENSFYLLPQLALVTGAQFTHAVRDRDDRFLSDGAQSGHRGYDLWSPKIGLLWEPDPRWQVFGNVSRSAEAPTFDANSFATPASTDLKAQTATTFEVGTRGRMEDLSWDVALFRSQLRNELQCLTTAPWSPCSVINAGRTVHQGIEAGLGIPLISSALSERDRLWLKVSYTYSDFAFDGDARYGDNRLPGVPEHSLRTELLYRHPSGFSIGPNVEWSPKAYYADNANQVKGDAYALLNLRATFDPGDRWSAYVEARNLTDTRYISSVAVAGRADANSEIFNPGTGRAVFAGMSVRW